MDVPVERSATKEKLFYSALRLFARKGYANVGVRELCRSVNIKESSFYNHYPGKESLFEAILAYFGETCDRAAMSEAEIRAFIEAGDVRAFLEENVRRFAAATADPPFHAALRIVLSEAYLRPKAAEMSIGALARLRGGDTGRVLTGLMDRGAVRRCNAETVTAEYDYALRGMLDEYLLRLSWNGDPTEINARIAAHIDFFTRMLQPSDDERNDA